MSSFATLSGWITTPDFVYHWGVKGRRFWLARGIDIPFLSEPLGWTSHPDYPQLLPSLYAATATLRGYFDARSMQAWSVVFMAGVTLAGRHALGRAGLRGFPPQAGVLRSGTWHGMPWLLVLLTPTLLLVGRVRAAAVVLLLQAGFYLLIYLASPLDISFYIRSSLPRLLYHLILPFLVLLVWTASDGRRE